MMEFEERIGQKMKQTNHCPVCSLLDDEEFQVLSRLQYDITHHAAIRERIAAEGGFCDFHFRQFRKIANSKTNALLLLALVEQYLASDCTLAVRCSLCAHLEDFCRSLIQDFARLLSLPSFAEQYQQSFGLCRGHLALVIALVPSEGQREALGDVHRNQIEREIRLLNEMASRSYYETSREARGSILRTLEKFAGRRALCL